jgi:magnesium chelatase family protein
MLATVHACALLGLEGHIVEVQVDFNPMAGVPSFTIVGLPDTAVKESRERVRAAIKNSGLQFPNKGYVVNLFPADLPKHSTAYDLAIAVGILAATDQLPINKLENAMFIGELSLDGTVRHVKGVLPMTYTAQQTGYEAIYVPAVNANEASLIEGIDTIPVNDLAQLSEHLYGMNPITPHHRPADIGLNEKAYQGVDFADIKGQEYIKRGLEIASAGGHNVIMTGVPGTGKSLMARALPSILPSLSFEEALEVTRIYSVAGMLDDGGLVTQRPFRAPHHTISTAGLVGGGTVPKAGEISLAHRGVLFLDEIVEYAPKVLEVMRQPIEDKIVTISRAKGAITYPANFLLVAARNPCPCGYYGDTQRTCTCTPTMIQRYQARLSGPLMDRIDIHLDVQRVDYDKLMDDTRGEPSATIRARVESARQIQHERLRPYPNIYTNADMTAGHIQNLCLIKPEAKQLLDISARKMQLSARSYHRMLKLSQTIADLAQSEQIDVQHVAEAIQYRPKPIIY